MRFWFTILALLAAMPLAAQETATFTFKSGSRVTYPATWHVEESDDATFVFVYNDSVELLFADPPALRSIGIHSNDPVEALERYFFPYDEALVFDPASVVPMSFGERRAARYSYDDTYEGTPLQATIFAVAFSEGGVGVVDVSYWRDMQLLQPVVMQIVATFDRPLKAPPLPTAAAGPVFDYTPVFEPDACPFAPIPAGLAEGENLSCGWLIVPENRTNPHTNLLRLAVAILRSLNPTPEPDPIIYLEGGPGGSALFSIDAWIDSPFRANRDLILIDQRGTGYSQPTLDCAVNDPNESETRCFERLVAEGVDLSAYTTATNAADIHDLIVALGLEQANLYGISYGTRLALTVMRDFPARVRSVVLDSVYPPDVNAFNEQTVVSVRAIQRLFDQCAVHPACAAAYGDIGSIFLRLVDKFNNQPVPYIDLDGNEVVIYGDDLVDTLSLSLYLTSAIPTLPYAIYLLDQGDYLMGMDVLGGFYGMADLQALAAGEDLPPIDEAPEANDRRAPDGESAGMFNAVECNEEVPFNALSAAYELAQDLPPQLRDAQLLSVEQMFDTCRVWATIAPPLVENQPVSSDIPALVLAGSFDPVTPPAWGKRAAEHLSRSFFFEFPHSGHSVSDSGDCAIRIMQAFINDPAIQPDSSCIGGLQVEFFILEPCSVTAVDTVRARYGPGTNFNVRGELPGGTVTTADVAALDRNDVYWFRLGDAGWVRRDAAEFSPSCNLVPTITFTEP